MSKGAESRKQKPAPPAGEWPRQLLAAEQPPDSQPALRQTPPLATLTATTPPPPTIEHPRRLTTSLTPTTAPPMKKPKHDLPTTKPGTNVFPPGGQTQLKKSKQPKAQYSKTRRWL